MAQTLQQMVQSARQAVNEMAPVEAKERLDRGEIAAVVDVREPAEFAEAHVAGALLVPRGVLELQADPSTPAANATLCDNRDATIVVYCTRSPSARSVLSAKTLARGDLATFAADAREAGVRYIGSCCGSVAEHVRAMAKILGKLPTDEREWRSVTEQAMSAYEYYAHTETEV